MKDEKKEREKQLFMLIRKRYLEFGRDHEIQEITLDTDIRKDLNFDSVMLVVLQIDIEDEFHIRFDPVRDDFQQIFTTVRSIGRYVEKCLGE